MTGTTALELVIATLNAAMVVVLLRFVPRFWRQMPWLPALTLYFAMRTTKRIVGVLDDDVTSTAELGLDLLALPILLLIIFNARRMIAGFQAAQDEAEFRRDEYDRARRDYQQLVRHRLFNPLTVIRGAALTIRAGVPNDQVRDDLLDAICEAAEAIRHTTLEPERQGAEERELDALPLMKRSRNAH